MHQLFEKLHDTVVEGTRPGASGKSLIEVPGLAAIPLRVRYQEFAGIVAGEVLNDDNTPVGKFLGYPTGRNAFEIVAVKPAGASTMADVRGVDTGAHLEAFAKRVQIEGYTFNPDYAM